MNSVVDKNIWKKYILELFVIMMIAFCLELFVFQFRVWQDLGNQEILVPLNLGSYTEDAALLNNGMVLFDQEKGESQVTFDLRSLEHQKISNIAIHAISPDGEAYWDDFEGNTYAHLQSNMVEVRMVLTTGENYVLVEPGAIGADLASADVISLPAGSRPDLITIQFRSLMGHLVAVSDIRLNVQRSIHFSLFRFVLTLVLLLIIRCLGPKSRMWKSRLTDAAVWKRGILEAGAAVIFTGVVFGFLLQNPVYTQGEAGFAPYRELTHALAKGQTWIEEMPSQELLSLKDPYSFMERMESGVKYKLDYALYEGKYYVYFGVIPCLLFFLPPYLLAGIDVPGWMVVGILLVALYGGLAMLLKAFIERYCRKISVAAYIFLRVGALAVFSIPAVVSDPNAYYIPMLSAVVFYVYGLWCYVKATQAVDAEHKELGWLIAGSVCMAFVAGCRPQLVLAVVVVLPLLLRYLINKKEKGVEICWKRCIAFALPYGIVAIGLMYYNAIRFTSPFDFGASYNLTFANTYHWKFHIEAVGAGILYYLFRLPHFLTSAPFLEMTHLEWSNPGLLANHTSTGGIYALYPVLWSGLLVFARKKDSNGRQKELRRMGVIWLILAIFMAVLTAAAGGLMDRYRMDYVIFAALAYVAGVINFLAHHTGEEMPKVRTLSLVIIVAAVLISILMYFEDGVWWIADANPEWYTKLSGDLAFWR